VCGLSGCKKVFKSAGPYAAFIYQPANIFKGPIAEESEVEYRFSNEPKILNDSWILYLRSKKKLKQGFWKKKR
jgi:hypothetical protein